MTSHSAGVPASRASWIGSLHWLQRTIPVKAYPAISTSAESLLRQFHAGCGQRIQQPRWCAQHGVVAEAEIVKAYEYAPEDRIELSEAELASIRPTDDKTLRLEQFFDPAGFDLVRLSGRSLHLAPTHSAALAEYSLAWQALRASGRWGFARMVLSNHRHPVVVRPAATGLVLHVLHGSDQGRSNPCSVDVLPLSPEADVDSMVAAIAQHSGRVDWNALTDDSATRLAELVQRKVAARARPVQTAAPPASRRRARKPGTTDRRRRSAGSSTPALEPTVSS